MSELDLELKLRMERALWAAGYYTRTNVRVASVYRTRGSREASILDLTDVDVLGTRFIEDLTPRRTTVDCKSGRRESPIGRTFWLAGVMQHFAAERGYVVLSRAIPEHHREAAASLGVSLLHESDINEFQARYAKLPENLQIGVVGTHKYLENNLVSLPKNLAPMTEFRDTMYWFYSAPRAIAESISVTRSVGEQLNLTQKFHRALLLDIATLFSLSSLTVAGQLLRFASSDVLETLRALFFGGAAGIARREQMIRRIRLIVEEISQQTELPFDDPSLFQLDPPYLTPVGEAIARVMARPLEAAQAPRYLKLRLVHGVLRDEWDIAKFVGDEYSIVADKLASDLVLALLRACGLNSAGPRILGASI
jgi:hypothetical protein